MTAGMACVRVGAYSALICVGIAVRGCPHQLAATLADLATQTLAPHAILIRCTEPRDAEELALDSKSTLYREPVLPCQPMAS